MCQDRGGVMDSGGGQREGDGQGPFFDHSQGQYGSAGSEEITSKGMIG